MTPDVGKPRVASLGAHTEDAGVVVGMGIIFESAVYADRFLQHLFQYFDTPPGSCRSFIVCFYDRGSYCDLAVDVANRSSTMTIDILQASHQVLDDLIAALAIRPYFFIIACITGQDGATLPYNADNSIVFQSRLLVDGKEVSGNRAGTWTRKNISFVR